MSTDYQFIDEANKVAVVVYLVNNLLKCQSLTTFFMSEISEFYKI